MWHNLYLVICKSVRNQLLSAVQLFIHRNLSFGIRTVCSCEGENLTLFVLHSGNENLTVSSSMSVG